MSLLDEIALSDDALEAWLAVQVNRRPLVRSMSALKGFVPRFATKANGNIDPRPWCHGFYAAMQLNKKDWKPLLDLGNINHGLLLPILIYCVDKKGNPVLERLRPGPENAHFIEHAAYLDIALVIPALKRVNNKPPTTTLKNSARQRGMVASLTPNMPRRKLSRESSLRHCQLS